MTQAEKQRLQAALDYQSSILRAEDCVRRMENRKLVLELDNARRIFYLTAWLG